MLRGRRLLWPQSPLSRWRTTASTTTTPSCQASCFTSQTPDDPTQAKEGQTKSREDEPAKEEDEQNRSNANEEAAAQNSRGPHFLTFRKYHIDGTLPLDAVHVHAKVPRRYLKPLRSENQPLNQPQGTKGRRSTRSPATWTTQVDYPQVPTVQGENATQRTEAWVNKVGNRLGLSPLERGDGHSMVPIARRMGREAHDPRLASPAMALADMDRRERLAKKATTASERQKELTTNGTKPAFLPRDYTFKGDPSFKSKQIKLRWSKLEAGGIARISPAQTDESTTPAQTEESIIARGDAGDLVGADLRDSLKDAEAASAQTYDARPAVEANEERTESFFQGRGSGLAGGDENPPQAFTGESAPTGIRFTVRPTWLPFDRPTKQKKKTTIKDNETRRSSEGAAGVSPIPKADSEDQQVPHSGMDIAKQSTSQLDPLVGDAPSIRSESGQTPPKQTDQASLSETPKSKEIHHSIFGMLFPEETGSESHASQAPGNVGRKAKPNIKGRARPETIRGGIYKQLFPDDASEEVQPQLSSQPQPGEPIEQQPLPNEEDLVPPEESIFVSLRNEIRNWIPEEERKAITAPEPGEYGSHSTVLILSGLSNSLVDTDFYRILPEAKHIEGWAGGLVKVVQARDALSYEPVGRYFLMFHSHPAADAYKAEVLRLHALSKRLLHRSLGTGPLANAPADPQPFLTAEEEAAVRSFTLCPPTAPLQLNVHMWSTSLIRKIAQSTDIADVVQALRPDVATPSKVLVTVNTVPGTLSGRGGGLTTDELWLTLRDDGRERGAPWVLANLKEGIMPVRMTSTAQSGQIDIYSEAVQAPLEGPIYDEQDMLAEQPPTSAAAAAAVAETGSDILRKVTYDVRHGSNVSRDDNNNNNNMSDKTLFLAPESRARGATVRREDKFNRFVVTFTQPAVARRFVRSWHKRAIWDAYEKRSVSIDAVALM